MEFVFRAASGLALAVLVLLPGCATTLHEGPKFAAAAPPKADEALVYLYRGEVVPYYFSPAILFDSVKIVDLPNRGYTHFYAKPGKRAFKSQWSPITGQPTLEGTFEFGAGSTYYLRMGGRITRDVKFSPYGKPQAGTTSRQSVETVLPEEGLHEMANLMYVRPEVERLP
jgi:hypothetical protein